MQNKIKITQKEFDDIYQIEEPLEITGETGAAPSSHDSDIPSKQDTTPESVLSEEEQEINDFFLKDYPVEGDVD